MEVYPLVMTNVAIEHGHRQFVDFPINSMVIFHSYVSSPVVVSTPLKNMTLSVGMIIPNIWKNKKCSKPPTRYELDKTHDMFINHIKSSFTIINSPSSSCQSLVVSRNKNMLVIVIFNLRKTWLYIYSFWKIVYTLCIYIYWLVMWRKNTTGLVSTHPVASRFAPRHFSHTSRTIPEVCGLQAAAICLEFAVTVRPRTGKPWEKPVI